MHNKGCLSHPALESFPAGAFRARAQRETFGSELAGLQTIARTVGRMHYARSDASREENSPFIIGVGKARDSRRELRMVSCPEGVRKRANDGVKLRKDY